jgi:gluconate 5-dehydrogenase
VLGPIDILVNNAGTSWGAPMADHPLEAWNKVLSLNLTAMFLVTQAVGKHSMIPRRRGKVINIASIAGLVGTDPDYMAAIGYNTSKGGVVNFTRSLAAEWAKYDVHVNAIAPGFFPTRMTKGLISSSREQIVSDVPLGRLGGDEDLKGVAALLASDASAFITGQIIAVDGGATAI